VTIEDFHEVDWHDYRRRGHDGKVCYDNPTAARAAAGKARRRTGDPINAYPCAWLLPGEPAHWHIGHPPSDLAAMERLAAAIRNHQNDTTQECA